MEVCPYMSKYDQGRRMPTSQALEEAGLPTVWPHPSYLYRTLAGKEWPSQLCLSPQYHVPLTVRVSRQAVLTKGQRAAEEAWQALCRLREAMGRPLKSAGVRAAVKAWRPLFGWAILGHASPCNPQVGYSWRSSGVQLCRDDVTDLSRALAKSAAAGLAEWWGGTRGVLFELL